MIPHVRGDIVVDVAGALVPERLWVSVYSHRAIDRLPCFELVGRPAMTPKHNLPPAVLSHADHRLAILRTHDVALRVLPLGARIEKGADSSRNDKCVGVRVNVDSAVVPKIDGVGVRRPRPPEKLRVMNLERERFPPAGRSAGEDAGVGLGDDSKALL